MSTSPARSDTSERTAVEKEHSSTFATPLKWTVVHPKMLSSRALLAVTYLLHLPYRLLEILALGAYLVYQIIIAAIFTPSVYPDGKAVRGRVAIIGTGLTGVATAAHLVARGFDVRLYEEKDKVGGIWADVNETSGLQLHSGLYRFFPSIIWKEALPRKAEIVGNIGKVWMRYNLQDKTRFNTKVSAVHRHTELSDSPGDGGHGRWVVNNGEDGVFDAIVACVGTTGEPKMIKLEGQDSFSGKIVHSSKLDGLDMEGKNILILGSGASGVEAAELAVAKKAKHIKLLAHSDKWIIPRNSIVDVALSLNPFGRETPFSFIWEFLLRKLHYRNLQDLSPVDKGIFAATPVVNTRFLQDIRQGTIEYIHGDAIRLEERGMHFHLRKRGERAPRDNKGLEENAIFMECDIIVMATGYQRPSIEFLPVDLFPETDRNSYHRPNLYLQNFSTEDWSVLLTNSAYKDAIGTVGNWHIGIYTRILIAFLEDKRTRPLPKDMKLWVDCIAFIKRNAPGGSLDFFSYSELIVWTVAWHIFSIYRLHWLPFVLFGFTFQLS